MSNHRPHPSFRGGLPLRERSRASRAVSNAFQEAAPQRTYLPVQPQRVAVAPANRNHLNGRAVDPMTGMPNIPVRPLSQFDLPPMVDAPPQQGPVLPSLQGPDQHMAQNPTALNGVYRSPNIPRPDPAPAQVPSGPRFTPGTSPNAAPISPNVPVYANRAFLQNRRPGWIERGDR